MKTTDSAMSQEVNKCEFCGVVKPVQRYYLTVKNKHFDDNKGGCYSTFIYYCQDCGIDSHSLAEARREWVEEIRGKVNDMKYRGIAHSDLEARRHNALLEKIEDLLTGDNPEEEK